MQFAHDFGNLRDPFPQQCIDFAAGGLNVFQVDEFQASEGQTFSRAALIDAARDAAGCIAADILHSQNLREAQRILEILIVFDRRTVIGNAANPGAISLARTEWNRSSPG